LPFLTLMLLAALGAGCSQQRQPPPTAAVDKQLMAEDSRAMAQRYAQWQQSLHAQALKGGANQQMPLDLSDEVQHRFVMNRLHAAGLNALTAPRLFSRLRDIQRRPEDRPLADPSRKTAQSGTDGVWCGHMISLGGMGSDATQARFEGTGLSSCFDGSDYGFVDLNAYVTNKAQTTFELLASQSYEEYAGKVLETEPLSISLPRAADKELLVDSLAMAFDETTGREHITYTSVGASLHSGSGDGDIVLEHPRDLLDLVPHDKAIRICLERGYVHGSLDCDYASVRANPDGTLTPFAITGGTGIAAVDVAATLATASGGGTSTWIADKTAYWEPVVKPFDATRFQVPTRGVFMPHVLDECQVEKVTSKVVAVLLDTGGWCEEGTSSGTVVGKGELPWKTPTMPREYPFDGILDFGKGTCVANSQNVRLEMWVYAEGTCPDPYYPGDPTKREPFRCPAKKEVKPVDYTRLCMAEGTQVVKADGKREVVEKVKVGDKLLANGNGLALTVTAVSRGGESEALVKLRDDHGNEVRVTATHPMVTVKRGLVQASELKVGEAVLTRTGATKLVHVERVPYRGPVYNFLLGTPEELAKAGPEARTMFANGFLVGDGQAQTQLEKQRRLDTRQVLAKLHGAWHEDYRQSQQRQARK
jgi:hypothetical protein